MAEQISNFKEVEQFIIPKVEDTKSKVEDIESIEKNIIKPESNFNEVKQFIISDTPKKESLQIESPKKRHNFYYI